MRLRRGMGNRLRRGRGRVLELAFGSLSLSAGGASR